MLAVAGDAAADEPKGDDPLAYRPVVGNPLQGLAPYIGEWAEWTKHPDKQVFPHTLEFTYIGLAELAPAEGRFDFAPLDAMIDQIAGRGHQAVFRVFLEYPGRENGIPKWLEESGVAVTRWKNPEAGEHETGTIATPDYEDPRTRKLLAEFIAAMGERYDGDPRVGYITAGLLGTWGEWHSYPRDELFASETVQAEVLDAYERAFSKTPILLRYPAELNADRPFGYHDDSFAWATLETGRTADDWFLMAQMNDVGATDKWKRHPIGGEIRPELWGKIFDAPVGQPKKAHRKAQDFLECVETTHATWLMDTGLFEKRLPKGEKGERRWANALDRVARLGYEFYVSKVAIDDRDVAVTIRNTGVAPLYHDWRPVLSDGSQTAKPGWSLLGLLPGQEKTFETTLPEGLDVSALRMQIPNALENGPPIRFANAGQDAETDGWLRLEG